MLHFNEMIHPSIQSHRWWSNKHGSDRIVHRHQHFDESRQQASQLLWLFLFVFFWLISTTFQRANTSWTELRNWFVIIIAWKFPISNFSIFSVSRANPFEVYKNNNTISMYNIFISFITFHTIFFHCSYSFERRNFWFLPLLYNAKFDVCALFVSSTHQ